MDMDLIELEEEDFQKFKDYIQQIRDELRDIDTAELDLQTVADCVGFEHFWFDGIFFGEGCILPGSQLLGRLDELPAKIARWLRTRRRKDMKLTLSRADIVWPVATTTAAPTDATGTASASGTTETAEASGDVGETDTADK